MIAKIALALTVVFLSIAAPSAAVEPQTGRDDSRAGMCAGFSDLAFAFCVAVCEARECDLQPPDDTRCTVLRRGFERVSGGLQPPC